MENAANEVTTLTERQAAARIESFRDKCFFIKRAGHKGGAVGDTIAWYDSEEQVGFVADSSHANNYLRISVTWGEFRDRLQTLGVYLPEHFQAGELRLRK